MIGGREKKSDGWREQWNAIERVRVKDEGGQPGKKGREEK